MSMYDAILELIRSLFTHGISWGSLVAVLIFLNRIQRANQYKHWNSDVSHNLKILMEHSGVGEQWRGQVGISKNEEVLVLKKLYSSLQVALNQVYQQRRKKTVVKALTSNISKKLIAFLVAAAVTALNDKLGLHLNSDTVYGIIALAIAYIAGQSHVDAKKAISNAVNAASTAVVQAAATNDGSPIANVIAPPMSYEETMKMIGEVHSDINRIFADAKNKDNVAAMNTAINSYMSLHQYFTKNEVNP